jgi:hypothetical protein
MDLSTLNQLSNEISGSSLFFTRLTVRRVDVLAMELSGTIVV